MFRLTKPELQVLIKCASRDDTRRHITTIQRYDYEDGGEKKQAYAATDGHSAIIISDEAPVVGGETFGRAIAKKLQKAKRRVYPVDSWRDIPKAMRRSEDVFMADDTTVQTVLAKIEVKLYENGTSAPPIPDVFLNSGSPEAIKAFGVHLSYLARLLPLEDDRRGSKNYGTELQLSADAGPIRAQLGRAVLLVMPAKPPST